MAEEHEEIQQTTKGELSRRELLKRAGLGAAALGISGSAGASKAFAFAGPHRYTGRYLKNELKIMQWVHFVPTTTSGWTARTSSSGGSRTTPR